MPALINAINDEISEKINYKDFHPTALSERISASQVRIEKISDDIIKQISNKKDDLFQKSLSLPKGRWLRAYIDRSGLIHDVYETTDAEMRNYKWQQKLRKIKNDLSSLSNEYGELLKKLRQEIVSPTQPIQGSSPLALEKAKEEYN